MLLYFEYFICSARQQLKMATYCVQIFGDFLLDKQLDDYPVSIIGFCIHMHMHTHAHTRTHARARTCKHTCARMRACPSAHTHITVLLTSGCVVFSLSLCLDTGQKDTKTTNFIYSVAIG